MGAGKHQKDTGIEGGTSSFKILWTCTIQYNNTTSFISDIEHNYTSAASFTQHWDGWKGGGQKNNPIVVNPQH